MNPAAEADIRGKVDAIIQQRRLLLPEVARESAAVKTRGDNVRELIALLAQLHAVEKDAESLLRIENASSALAQLVAGFEDRLRTLEAVERRFSRDSVVIGVSGEARVGKSTTLQKLAGLTDTQIPTGDGLPVTAVRSEIVNSPEEFAEVTFRDHDSFISDYISPLLDGINSRLQQPLSVENLAGFKKLVIPDKLGDNVDSVASDSLRRLREAQRSAEGFSKLLGSGTMRLQLPELRRYVAYPTNQQIRDEEKSGVPADRAYIAVESVKIFCPFPRLDGVKIGLVDLPGLGEVGASVADIHLDGLEDGIDQIVPIMRPTESEGFVKQGIASNLDHLRRVQPGIRRRGDLITAAINVYEGLDTTVQTLQEDFERQINGAQSTDRIEVILYSAVDETSVGNLLDWILKKIAERLPVMDQEVFAYALGAADDEDKLAETVTQLNRTMSDLLRRMPLPDRLLNQQINRTYSAIVDAYNKYEVDLVAAVGKKSGWYEEFDDRVKSIHGEIEQQIADGFFLGSAEWESAALGQADYYNWYRDECKRMRREIIARYSGLDTFYDDHVISFKLKVIQILIDNTGDLYKKFRISRVDSPESRIEKISSELSGTVRDDDLESALGLLKSVQFSFRNNVFLQISKHLERLANPIESSTGGKNIREVLGNVGDIDEKIKKLGAYLSDVATVANRDIRDALLKHDDRFHEYLAVSISFFIDYLYRKDAENFKHVVVRGILNEYRDLVASGELTALDDVQKKDLIEAIKVAGIEVLTGRDSQTGLADLGSARRAPGETATAAVEVGSRFRGRVNGVQEYGVFVTFGGDHSGLVHKSVIKGLWPQVGDALEVEVTRVKAEGKIDLMPV